MNNKLTKVETLYVPCGTKITHFKVKCDPDDEGNFMQCNVEKQNNKYLLDESDIIKLINDAWGNGYELGSSDSEILSDVAKRHQYIKQILNNADNK